MIPVVSSRYQGFCLVKHREMSFFDTECLNRKTVCSTFLCRSRMRLLSIKHELFLMGKEGLLRAQSQEYRGRNRKPQKPTSRENLILTRTVNTHLARFQNFLELVNAMYLTPHPPCGTALSTVIILSLSCHCMLGG